jgi:DNA-binding NtrC family response regulator
MKAYPFPGNVRELINIVKQAVAMCDRRQLDDYLVRFMEPPSPPAAGSGFSRARITLGQAIETVEHDMLMQAAATCRTTREAAAFLGVSQPTVVRKFKKHGISMTG